MDIVDRVLVLVHLIGFAALLGGLLVQGREPHPEVNATMLAGAWIELITGAGLVALVVIEDQTPHYAQLSVKLALTLFIVLLVAKNRKFETIPRGLWVLLTLMTLINAGLAVLWQ
jgi:hypothetical protein